MRVSRPRAEVTTSMSASGSLSQIRADMFAKLIFVVTYVLTASFAIFCVYKVHAGDGG